MTTTLDCQIMGITFVIALLIVIVVLHNLIFNYIVAHRQRKRVMWEAELKWVQGQIDLIDRQRASIQNEIQLRKMYERRKRLWSKLGV